MKPSSQIVASLIVAVAYCTTGGVVRADPITVISNDISVQSTYGTSSDFNGTSIPSSGSLATNGYAGWSDAQAQVNNTGSANQTTLQSTINLAEIGDGFEALANGVTIFTANTDSTYSLSGSLSVTDNTTQGFVFLQSILVDLSQPGQSIVGRQGSDIFVSQQASTNTVNQNFVVGGNAGDGSFNYPTIDSGAQTGTLIAGDTYEWYQFADISSLDDGDTGATAVGFQQLDIGGSPVSSAPDGGTTAALLGGTLLGLAVLRRKVARV